jgi:hypothetical protein
MFRFLIIFLCSFSVFSNNFAEGINCSPNQCLAVVDAGSSGSRLHVYALDNNQRNGVIQIKEKYYKSIQPGLSSLNLNQKSINQYLETLFDNQSSQQIPVFFYATAGMRMIPVDKQNQYYSYIHTWFANQSAWQLEAAKTISGQEEGLYSWLSVNFEQGHLFNKHKQLAIMDMGGASVQVVFPVNNIGQADAEDIINIQLKNEHLKLFVHSFLGLGSNETIRQYLVESSCYPRHYPLNDGISGQGDEMACRNEIQALVNQVHHVNQRVQAVILDNPVNAWYTLGGLAYLADKPAFKTKKQAFNMADLAEKVDMQVCQQNWTNLKEIFPNDDYLFTYCLSAAYYRALVIDGYGLAENQTIHYDQSDWTKGVVVKIAYAIETKEL